MGRPSAGLWIAIGIVHWAGCAPAPREPEYAADTASIHQLYRNAPAVLESGSVDRYVAMVDDGITLAAPGVAPVHGIPALRELLDGFFRAARYRAVLAPPHRLLIADSLAFAEYAGRLTTLSASGADSVTAENHYADVLRRQSDGSWRILVHGIHDLAPAPPAR